MLEAAIPKILKQGEGIILITMTKVTGTTMIGRIRMVREAVILRRSGNPGQAKSVT
jgi:hypothetical protein